jgi:hypothetical protein
MATAPISRKLNLTRDQLATFLTDQQQIRQFELLFSTVDAIAPDVVNQVNIAAGTAQATANEALAQLAYIAQELAVNCALAENKANQALELVDSLTKAVQALQLTPSPSQLDTLAKAIAAETPIQDAFDDEFSAPKLFNPLHITPIKAWIKLLCSPRGEG